MDQQCWLTSPRAILHLFSLITEDWFGSHVKLDIVLDGKGNSLCDSRGQIVFYASHDDPIIFRLQCRGGHCCPTRNSGMLAKWILGNILHPMKTENFKKRDSPLDSYAFSAKDYQKSLCHSVWLVFLFVLSLPVCPTLRLGHCLFYSEWYGCSQTVNMNGDIAN